MSKQTVSNKTASKQTTSKQTASKQTVKAPEEEFEEEEDEGEMADEGEYEGEEEDEEEGDDEEEEDGGGASPKESSMSKPRHSATLHLQAELMKQKVLKSKQDRETRRAALDTHHHYLMDLIAFYTDQKLKEIEEFVIDSQDCISLFDSFFKEDGNRVILFYFQDHDTPGPESGRTGVPTVPGAKKEKVKRLMLTNGTDIPMKGICLYFLRPNTTEKLTVKNVADECYFGTIPVLNPDEPGNVVEAVNDMLKGIFLRNLKGNTTWVTIPDVDMALKVKHRFLTAITNYSDFLVDCKNDIAGRLDLKEISNLDEIPESAIKTTEDIMQSAKNPEIVQMIEHAVIIWCKHIERVLATSKQMRKETDTMGPLAELAYWRNLMAKMCYIIQQTQEWQIVNMIQVLMHSKSKVLRRWKDVDSRVSDEFHESRDNVRYLYALEKFCQPLYEQDPPGMIEHINSMMYTIRTIHTTSRYYNTCEKITALMVKISNQMVASCRRYLTNDGTETIWNQGSDELVDKLHKCIALYEMYRGSYEATKAELQNSPDGKNLDVSVNHIFGRFERFCDRLKKIIQIEEIFNLYYPVHVSTIDGLEDISFRLKMLQDDIKLQPYDPLEFRQPNFDNDFVGIRSAIDEIQTDLEKFMDTSIEACPTAMHGLRLLERFQALKNRCLDIDSKLWYLFQFYHNEIVLIQQIYEAEKNETPTPRGYPPFAGKISWARHLYMRLERPMKWFQEKTDVLQREGVTPTIKLFNSVAKKLVFYEILFHESWVTQCNSIYDALEAPLLTLRGSMRQELVLNFDPFFGQIVEETEIIRKMELDVPDIAQVVYCKRDKLYETYERIKGLLERFLSMKTKIPQDMSVLMRPIVKKVEKAFMPGVTNINWTSFKTDEYFNYIETHQNELEAIIQKVQVSSVQINQVLNEICHTLILDLPEDHPVASEEFMEQVHRYGSLVGDELEFKSRICENAVGQLINNLLAACDLHVPDDPYFIWLTNTGPPPIPATDDAASKSKKDKPLVDPTLMPTQMTREEMLHLYEECKHVFAFYNQKCIEALQKATRISLDILRGRTDEPQVSKRNPGKILNRVPLFTADLILTIPTIAVKPALADMQQVLNRAIQMICEPLKKVTLWGQKRPEPLVSEQFSENDAEDKVGLNGRLQHTDPFTRTTDNANPKLKNCFKHVMEHKDVSKLVLMMQTVVVQAKPRVQHSISQHMHYSFLWKETRDEEVAAKIIAHPITTEIEGIMRTYKELDDEIENIPDTQRAGPLDLLTRQMKDGFHAEVKEWKLSYCRHLSKNNKMLTLQITKFINECNKELQMPIKDMNDLFAVMSTLMKIRENQGKYYEMMEPIEDCYKFLKRQSYRVPDEESDRAFALRGNFSKLLTKASQTMEKMSAAQDKNKANLVELVTRFQKDLNAYMERYESKGPMKEGLTVDVATERLYIFQDEFDDLWERYTMCSSGEKLLGGTRNEYPQLDIVKKQLSLLQKLYSLYNDVIRVMNSYAELRWRDVDMSKVTQEMDHFQIRCTRLPKSIREWAPYKELTQKIADLNEFCTIGQLLTNEGLKAKHWEKLTKLTGFNFDVQSDFFTLKMVMEAAPVLLQKKKQIEEMCNQAIKEKEIEEKMRQLEMMNEFG